MQKLDVIVNSYCCFSACCHTEIAQKYLNVVTYDTPVLLQMNEHFDIIYVRFFSHVKCR